MKKFFAAAKLILTLKCEHSSHLISNSFDRKLSAVERWAVRLHHIGCWSCRRCEKQIRVLRSALKFHPEKTAEDERLSNEALNRIRNAIREN